MKLRAHSSLPRVGLIFPLHRGNYTNLEERVKLSIDSGCHDVEFGFFRDWGGRFENYCLLPGDMKQVRGPFLWAKKQLESAKISHNIDFYLAWLQHGINAWLQILCYVGWYHSCIKVDGTALPCSHCSLVPGNAREIPFTEIWNSTAYEIFEDVVQIQRNCSLLEPNVIA